MNRTELGHAATPSPAAGATPTRRRLGQLALGGAAAGAAMAAMPNISRAETTVLRVQGAWAAQDLNNDMAVAYVERVNKMGGNRLRIDYLLSGTVVKPVSIQDAVNDGVLDGGHHVTAYW